MIGRYTVDRSVYHLVAICPHTQLGGIILPSWKNFLKGIKKVICPKDHADMDSQPTHSPGNISLPMTR